MLKPVITFLFVCLVIQLCATDFFEMPHSKKRITFPFQLVNNNILIPLTINNSDTLYCILDSGLSNTLITELFPEDSLELKNAGEETIKGLGGNASISVIVSHNNAINIQGLAGKNQRVNLIKEDIFNLSQLSGHKINGIIGYDFLKNFIIKVDYKRQLMTVYNPKHYQKKWRKYMHFPMEIIKEKPYVNFKIVAPNNKLTSVKLMIDTGASLSLWLIGNERTKIPLPEKTISSYLGQGLSGKVHGEYGRISKLIMGSKQLNNVLAAFPCLEDVQEAITEGRNGSIGGEILKRFYVILDYPNQKIALKPNANFHKPFEYNQSGIEIYTPSPKLPIYRIFALREDSPAKAAGLKEDDIILKINGFKTFPMDFSRLVSLLEKRKKRGTKLLIRRGDKLIEIKYYLPKESII